MGLYVHSGYEMLPRWWNRSWATKWFISATFHEFLETKAVLGYAPKAAAE